MALYRFLFAPVLLAVAVLTTSPHRAPRAPAPPAVRPAVAHAVGAPALVPARARAAPSHPVTPR